MIVEAVRAVVMAVELIGRHRAVELATSKIFFLYLYTSPNIIINSNVSVGFNVTMHDSLANLVTI